MPCPIGSKPSAARFAISSTRPATRLPKRSSTNRPYFVLQGNICALLAARDHVNVFLYDGAIVPDPAGIITGGHENKSARTLSIRQGEHIKAPDMHRRALAVLALLRA